MPYENDALKNAKKDQTQLNTSWSRLKNNDTNFLYAAGAGLLSVVFKRPFFSLMSGFGAGFLYNKRAQLVSNVQSDQARYLHSYRHMMRQDGVGALNDPDVLELTETAAENKPLDELKAWREEDLQPRSTWWGFWQSAPVSPDALSRLEKMKDKEQLSTDLKVQDVNIDQLRSESVKRAKEFVQNQVPEQAQEVIQKIRSGL